MLWRQGKINDLNDLVVPAQHGWTLVSAEDISDSGYIVGYGYPPGVPNLRPFLLTPYSPRSIYETPKKVMAVL